MQVDPAAHGEEEHSSRSVTDTVHILLSNHLLSLISVHLQYRSCKSCNLPIDKIYNIPLEWIEKHKYLGFYINTCFDDDDINGQNKSLYATGNTLPCKYHSFQEVKIQLCLFCTNLYCSSLMTN